MQQLSNNYKHPARIHQQFIRNSFENHSNPSKIEEKPTLRRGCIFGAALGAKREAAVFQRRPVLGAIFDQKSEKVSLGSPKETQSREKEELNIHAKIDTEKNTKSMGKGYQHDAKMDAEIHDFFECFQKR